MSTNLENFQTMQFYNKKWRHYIIVKLGCLNYYIAFLQESYFSSHQNQQIFLQIVPFVHIEVYESQFQQYLIRI